MKLRNPINFLSAALFISLLFIFACQKQVIKKADKDTVSNFENADSSRGPILVENVTPEYPEQAFREGIEGVVWVKVAIDSTGRVIDATIAKDSGKNVGFEEAALKAAYKTKWKPALEKGQPIAILVTYRIDFLIRR